MTSVQMNVRIDDALKADGDAAFADFGWTPSGAVRMLWGFAARNRRHPKRLRELMDTLAGKAPSVSDEDATSRQRAEVEAWLERGPAAVDAFFADAGIDRATFKPLDPEGYDDAIADYLAEDEERIRLGLSWDEFDASKGRG